MKWRILTNFETIIQTTLITILKQLVEEQNKTCKVCLLCDFRKVGKVNLVWVQLSVTIKGQTLQVIQAPNKPAPTTKSLELLLQMWKYGFEITYDRILNALYRLFLISIKNIFSGVSSYKGNISKSMSYFKKRLQIM